MSDRIVVLRDGNVEQVGQPLDLYHRPANKFVAGFIGSPAMNFVSGVVAEGGDKKAKVKLDNGQSDIVVPLARPVQSGEAISLGIRPEHLVPDQKGGIEIVLQIAEPLGANTLLHGRISGSDQAITASLSGVHQIDADRSRRFSVKPDHIHLFDPASGTSMLEHDWA